jgi:hypothetical protein
MNRAESDNDAAVSASAKVPPKLDVAISGTGGGGGGGDIATIEPDMIWLRSF